jgi:hypothetical protein
MLIEDEFKRIYLNFKLKEIVPFLTKLTSKEKKETAAVLKKSLNKNWGHNHISVLAALACSNTKEEYDKLSPGYYALPVNLVDELFESYVPDWIGDSYTFLRNAGYFKAMEWQKKGYCSLNNEISAGLLSESLVSEHSEEELFFTYPQTLNSHIWLLFEYPSDITYHYRKRNWKDIFKDLIRENKIDRSRVLKSALHAVNQNFSKEHNTWFLELFSWLEPSSKEAIDLQDELFLIFHSPQQSLFVPVLKTVGQIITEPDFKIADFVSAAEPLISLPVKNIVNTLLQTLDKIAKNNTAFREQICLLIMPVFLHKDAAVQTKAAKMIVQYGDPGSELIQHALNSYAGSFLADAGKVLEKYLPVKKNNDNTSEDGHELTAWHLSEPISPVRTINDFIFFAPQVFIRNNPEDFELFVDALMRFNTEINEEHWTQLEPAFKAALKRKSGEGLHHLLAAFFISYALMKQKKVSPVMAEAKREFPDLKDWGGKRTPLILRAYHRFLSEVFELLKQNKNLPLLSVPDHTPCWISMNRLTDKLKIYQEQNEIPMPFDLQLALLKTNRENLQENLKYAEKKLDKTYFKLLKPVSDPDYYKNTYENTLLEGRFTWETGIRKLYRGSHTDEVPELTVNIENQKEIPENASLLDYLFNSYHGIYQEDLIRILYTAPYFTGSVIAKKYNETLSNASYQFDIRGNTELLDSWMKLNLPFQEIHYLYLSAVLLNKDKTLSGTAFEALIHKIVSEDFDASALGVLIGEMFRSGMAPVKRLTDGLAGFTSLSSSHNHAFEKLLKSILTVIDQPVFNLKKLLEFYYELIQLNQSETDKAVIEKLKEWENENNLKKIIIKLKTNERKTL